MRAMFGLTSLLVCTFIVVYLWSIHTSAVSKSAAPLREEANQMSGHDENGRPATASITTTFESDSAGHHWLLVTDVEAGGAMEKFYGLQKGDKINGTVELSFDFTTDGGSANAELLQEGYEKSKPLDVTRNGQKITLPLPAVPAANNPVGANP